MKTQGMGLVLLLVMFTASSGPQFPIVGAIERLDPALDTICPKDALIEKVAGGFKFTEGPVWSRAGSLLFSDIPDNSIKKWTPNGKVTVFMHPSGTQDKAPYEGPESGSNGLTLDNQGRVTIAQHGNRRVVRLEKDGTLKVLAEKYEGKRLNSPNDLVWKSDGSLYFTDPPYGLRTQGDDDPLKELPFNGVYRIVGAARQRPGALPADAKLQLLIKDLTRPNGIAFSPDETYLYVDNSQPQELLMRYEVKPDGTLGNGTLFYDVTSSREESHPDGLKVDQKGDIFMTGPGGVWIFSPQGKHLGTIKPPEIPANCNWGDADGKTLYMTARTGLYRVRLAIAGVRP